MVQMEEQYFFIYNFLEAWFAYDDYKSLFDADIDKTKSKKKKCIVF
jgi:hypothetical protein